MDGIELASKGREAAQNHCRSRPNFTTSPIIIRVGPKGCDCSARSASVSTVPITRLLLREGEWSFMTKTLLIRSPGLRLPCDFVNETRDGRTRIRIFLRSISGSERSCEY